MCELVVRSSVHTSLTVGKQVVCLSIPQNSDASDCSMEGCRVRSGPKGSPNKSLTSLR